MNDETSRELEGRTPAGDAGSANGAPVQARRRLIKGGLSAGPVILTLTSRPVLGFEQACVAPSRMISGNFSGFAGPLSCGGRARSSYKDEDSKPEPGSGPFSADSSFLAVFGAPPYALEGPDGPILDPTLAQVFDDSNDKDTVASYLIAALWNVAPMGSITVLTPSQIVHMWQGVNNFGGYCPQPGMCWNALGVIGYLTNSGIVPE